MLCFWSVCVQGITFVRHDDLVCPRGYVFCLRGRLINAVRRNKLEIRKMGVKL